MYDRGDLVGWSVRPSYHGLTPDMLGVIGE